MEDQIEKRIVNKDDLDLVLAMLPKEDLVRLQTRIMEFLSQKYSLTASDVLQLRPGGELNIFIPITVFGTELSPSESITKFLKEKHNLTFSQIAEMIGKETSSVWSSYKRTQIKVSGDFAFEDSDVKVPINAFAVPDLSILEALVLYVVDTKKLKISQVSSFVKKNKSTLWTAYNRAKKKIKEGKK